nr:ATP-grasp domain-containing protein [Kribbella turkmenica]
MPERGASSFSVTYETARRWSNSQHSAAPAVAHADEFVQVSTRDAEKVAAALAGRDDMAGVLGPASDLALPSQRWLARHWKLPGAASELAVRSSNDKSMFREICGQLGFPHYASVAGSTVPELCEAARALRFPTLVKPVDSTGSRGVVLCLRPDSLTQATPRALEHSPSRRVTVEEYVEGMPLTVEALVDNRQVVLYAVSARVLTPSPYFITERLTLPADLPSDVDRRLGEMLRRLCEELDYASGPLNLDLVLSDGDLYLIEMEARTGGNGIAELVETAYGVDLLTATISLAVGDVAAVNPHEPRQVILSVVTAETPGRLRAIHGLGELAALPGFVSMRMFVEPGDLVEPYTQAAHKIGYYVLSGDTPAAVQASARTAQRLVQVELESP